MDVNCFNKRQIKHHHIPFGEDIGDFEKILSGEWDIPVLCKTIMEQTSSKLCSIILHKRESDDGDLFNIIFSTHPQISLCKHMPLFTLVFASKSIIISNDVASDPRNDNFEAKGCQIKKFCGIPIIKNGTMYGQIILANRNKGYSHRTVVSLTRYLEMISLLVISQDDNLIFRNDTTKNDLRFLSTIAHEIRTPIHSIVNMIGLLSNVGKLNEKQKEYVSCALSSCEDLIKTVKDSIDFQKIKAGSLGIVNDTFDLKDEISKCMDIVRFKADRKGLYLKYDIDRSVPPTVYGDKDRLRQVILNILENAIKFTERGGVCVTVQQYPSRVIISISDTGYGIKPDNISKVFIDYYQEEINGKNGMGLGLALSKRLTQMMGGEITVESTYGKGSTFTIDLSLSPDIYNVDDLPPNIRALVVDPNEMTRIQLRKHFTEWGVGVDTATTFKEAKTMAEYTEYNIVLMNISSNIGEAFQFSQFITDKYNTIKLVSTTKCSGDNNCVDSTILNVNNKIDVYNTVLSAFKSGKRERKKSRTEPEHFRVCIVEDDDISAYALKEMLISFGVLANNIFIVNNGEQAVRDITHSRYDVIFMDCKLRTEMNGIQATRLIKESIVSLPIYGVTAAITDLEHSEWLHSGVDAIITKPFDKNVIKNIISSYFS